MATDPLPPGLPLSRLVALLLVVIMVAVGALRARPPTHVTIEVGPIGGSYQQTALRYQAFFAARGIELEIRPKANSLEILKDVADAASGIDIGFEAQDVSGYRDSNALTVGHIQLQPLFIFASADLGRRIALTDLRGRKIVMPPSDSATSDAAVRMLQLYDITPDNSTFTFMPLADAAKELRAGHFHAGAFMLAPENAVIRGLMAWSGLRLLAVPEAKAIANHLPFLRPVVLPRGIYDIADGIPPTDVAMLAGTVDVVVRKDLHPAVVYALLDAMVEVHRGATFLSSAGAYPTVVGTELTIHPLAQQYYLSGKPWIYRELPPWLASFVDRYFLVALGIFVLGEIVRNAGYFARFASFALGSLAVWMLRGAYRSVERNGRLSGPQRLLVRAAERLSHPTSVSTRIDDLLAGIRGRQTGA